MSEPQVGQQVPAARREVLVVLPGLLLALLLALLDNTIVATAMPRIVGELGGVDHLSWVVTAYILATTVSTPLYGKLGDLYGRKRIFLTAIVIFLIGSALSGLSQNMAELIAFRAIQGLGAGGLMVSVMAIFGDLIPPRERARYQGYTAALMALATIGGPLVGGLLTDHFSWRWAFYINIPLGVIALALITTTLHLPRHTEKRKIDFLGASLIAIGASSVVLLATWGGSEYAWDSWQIIGLGVLTVVSFVALIFVERRAAEPILPLHLFADRNFTLTAIMGFLVGGAMFGAITFLPLYQQTVQGASATNSGLLLLPMMLGMTVSSLVSGQFMSRTGNYKILPILGGASIATSMFLLSTVDVDTSTVTTAFYMVLLGVGMGLLMQVVMTIAQNSVHPRDMGVASSTSTFTRSIGGSLGVALFGVIFSNTLQNSLPAGGGVGGSGANIDPAALAALPASVREGILTGIADATGTVFAWAAPVAAMIFVLALAIKAVPLRGREPSPAPVEQDKEAALTT